MRAQNSLVSRPIIVSEDQVQSLVQQLYDSDWMVRGTAIRKLAAFDRRALPALPRLFELTFDSKAPVRSDSEAVISSRIGVAAVDFLLTRASSDEAQQRANALRLLMAIGNSCLWNMKLATQWLGPRESPLPDWGTSADQVRAAFVKSLSDPNLSVRFFAALAVDEFGIPSNNTVAVLLDVLGNGTMHQKNWAALVLGRIGPAAKAGCSLLVELAKSSDHYASLAAKNALQRIGCAGVDI